MLLGIKKIRKNLDKTLILSLYRDAVQNRETLEKINIIRVGCNSNHC